MAQAASPVTLVDAVALRAEGARPSLFVPALSVAFITALTAAAAQFSAPLPFTSVPLTLQPMVVLLGGLVLGSRLGAASQVAYLAMGLAGLPVFAASATLPPGPLRLLGPTGGYLLAYPAAAFVAGYLAERGFDRRYATSVLAMLAGLVLIYLCGVAWLGIFARVASGSASIGLGPAFVTGLAPFILPDLIKLVVAAAIVPGLWRLLGRPDTTSV